MDSVESTLTEEDFKDAPETEEPDGVYQMLFTAKKIYFRNIDTGVITSSDLHS